jgi:protein tyrosine phosphatase (PTP) superfamily phosphohydrolase (DUF442 family)
MRLAWEEAQALHLVCTEAGAEVLGLRFRAPPSRLDLPGGKAEATITQRTSKAVPGSDGYLAIYLDDITAGQARLSLATADGEDPIDGKSVREGDSVTFATRDTLYALTVTKLVNYLLGDDYGVLEVARATPEMEKAEQERIRGFLAALAKEEASFLAGKAERTAAEVAASLRARLDSGAAKAPTLERFIDRVASRSPDTGQEMQVRGASGERIRARTWLDALAAKVPDPRKRRWAEAIGKPGLPNLHRVGKNLYRGAQPTAEGMRELEAMGVKTVLNLRALHSDRDLLEGTGLGYVEIDCEAWDPDEEEVVAFLKAVSDETKGPYFVHCQHGADRTGMMIAIHRVVREGWSKADAIEEMTEGAFGFHPIWSGLPDFVRDLDVEAVRRKAGLPASR